MAKERRSHPALQGKFHPDNPDDVQVVVHDGGPRLTNRAPEFVWATITGQETRPFGDVFTATVLNAPRQLQTVRIQQVIRFVASEGFAYPVMVTDKYLSERENWSVSLCPSCGMPELFDAPSDLIRKAFPHLPPDAIMEQFTTFCPSCLSVRVVAYRSEPDAPYSFTLEVETERRAPFSLPGETSAPARQRKWWEFWKG